MEYIKDINFFAHNGGTIGHSTFFLHFINDKISIAFVTNQLGMNLVSYLLQSAYVIDLVLGQPGIVDKNTICKYSNVSSLFPKDYQKFSPVIVNPEVYEGKYLNNIYGTVSVTRDPKVKNYLIYKIGIMEGKLRNQNVNNFLWFTENGVDGEHTLIMFTVKNNSAIEVSMNLEPKLPRTIFYRIE